MQKDHIIIGQGLAGSILALELLARGKRVLVIDEPSLSSCSKVAGGIYNPVVFKRLTRSWMAEAALPVMFDFFAQAEKRFEEKLIHHAQIARVFSNENEEALWKKKAVNELTDLIDGKIKAPAEDLSFLKNNYALVTKGGSVDVPLFLKRTREHLVQTGSFSEEVFDYEQLTETANGIKYRNVEAGKIIFCQGHLSVKNPFFKNVKFKPAKGEVLVIECTDLHTEKIVNKDIFILPLPQKHHYKIGATYNWEDRSDTPTAEAKNSLVEKLGAWLPFPYKIIEHQAGVRPSTIDRRPVMGFHPEHRNIGIFNGFGTKSVMLAPYFAQHFCSFFENNSELLQEVNLKRFF